MSQALPNPAFCCQTCDDPDAVSTSIPGPAGPAGADGIDGLDGINAFTTTTANGTQPAVGSDVTLSVADSRWAAVGQIGFVEGGGYYEVRSKPNSVSIELRNLGYSSNVPALTAIPSGSQVSPGGEKGVDGDDGTPVVVGPQIYTGSGSPEGVVTAIPGSLYIEITGGVFIAQWVKQTGAGNTGWGP